MLMIVRSKVTVPDMFDEEKKDIEEKNKMLPSTLINKQKPNDSLAAAWQHLGSSLGEAWEQLGRSLAAAWQQLGSSLAAAWQAVW